MPTSSLICALVLSLSVPAPIHDVHVVGPIIGGTAEEQAELERLAQERLNAFRGTEMGRAYIDGNLAILIRKLEVLSPESREAAMAEMKKSIEANTTPEERERLQALAEIHVSNLKLTDFWINFSLLSFVFLGFVFVYQRHKNHVFVFKTAYQGSLNEDAKNLISSMAKLFLPMIVVTGLTVWASHIDEIRITQPIDYDVEEFLEWVEEL